MSGPALTLALHSHHLSSSGGMTTLGLVMLWIAAGQNCPGICACRGSRTFCPSLPAWFRLHMLLLNSLYLPKKAWPLAWQFLFCNCPSPSISALWHQWCSAWVLYFQISRVLTSIVSKFCQFKHSFTIFLLLYFVLYMMMVYSVWNIYIFFSVRVTDSVFFIYTTVSKQDQDMV